MPFPERVSSQETPPRKHTDGFLLTPPHCPPCGHLLPSSGGPCSAAEAGGSGKAAAHSSVSRLKSPGQVGSSFTECGELRTPPPAYGKPHELIIMQLAPPLCCLWVSGGGLGEGGAACGASVKRGEWVGGEGGEGFGPGEPLPHPHSHAPVGLGRGLQVSPPTSLGGRRRQPGGALPVSSLRCGRGGQKAFYLDWLHFYFFQGAFPTLPSFIFTTTL